ncbi:hypothetical protein C8T65DRAFT_745490 [Cerioporus squamosus]|nr:hypothetical protein C8T65DRAFT_745490 [Cerioporus squamosus]
MLTAQSFIDRDMYMRYLGGGVGHREQGVTLAHSRDHASRIKRTGRIRVEATARWRTVTNTQIDVDSDAASDDEDSDTDSEEDDDDRMSDSDEEDEIPDNASNGSHESEVSVADFYARVGLRGRDRVGSEDEDGDHKDDLDAGSVNRSPERSDLGDAVDQGGVEADIEDLGSVDGRMSVYEEDKDEGGRNAEDNEDFHMDQEYEAEGFARL